MTELTIYGRGGQGGVTLAKLIATLHFLRGKHAQAFGVYAAERSGAPLQAYVRIDDAEIVTHNQIYQPDHAIVLDRTLITPAVSANLKRNAWLILNTSAAPESFAEMFAGLNVACVDATAIAGANGLGTRTTPIVNTTMLGAVARTLGQSMDEVEAALHDAHFGGANLVAARQAFETTRTARLPGEQGAAPRKAHSNRIAGILDPDVGAPPTIRTGTWANRRPERRDLTPPCNHVCPAGNDVRAFVAAMARKDYTGALQILLETSPLPAVCGRVCPAPCMESCNRGLFDGSVNVRDLERFAADHGQIPAPDLANAPMRDEQIAIVGSGPAGLSAAYHLARLGYAVSIFDAVDELGGLLRSGIPEYRLPREVLDREIAHILAHGVTARLGERIDRARLLQLTREFNAVFVATGLQSLTSIDLGCGSATLVCQGIDFLDRARQGQEDLTGLDVIVVGGGNTAMDAARTALRVGAANVKVIYRRTRHEMPAIAEEIDEAIEERIELHELVLPLRLDAEQDGERAALTCQRMRLSEPDESGRRRPVPDVAEDAQFVLRCNRVILALGQSADLSILPEGSSINDRGALLGLSGAPIFAGGDVATNDGTVAAAIGSGHRAALHIHRTLSGEDLLPPSRDDDVVAGPDDVHVNLFERSPRHVGPQLPAHARRRSFLEVRQGLEYSADPDVAVAEAQRCFSCGVCNSCDRCLEHCPEGILRRDLTGYRFDYDYCKGCGVCASECPRGVIYMAEL